MPGLFAFYECGQPDCRFRFPGEIQPVQTCPRCRQPVGQVAQVAQVVQPVCTVADGNHNGRSPSPTVHLLLDNIRSLHNVGSIFRTADGAGVGHLYLCGITPTPDNPRLAKTALGAQNSVSWSYHPNGVETAVSLQQSGYYLWAIEATPDSRSLFATPKPPPDRPLLLLVGNEKAGVDPGLLALSEQAFHLPMRGYKRSLNVAVVAGTAVYHLLHAGLQD
jgi:23S rRNA (guanosine2251-2'-O)-methyltransferase